MPKPLQYKTGSLIYTRGEKDPEKIFILQNGKVSLVYEDIETGEDARDQVQPGEFFGVKSALGRFPREENAIVMEDSTIAAFTVPEFELYALSNTRIIMKMLKVFSNQMRRIHDQVSNLLETTGEEKPDEGLFGLGEKFLKRRRYSHAKHVFGRYLALYPSGKKVAQAERNLQSAEAALKRGGGEEDQGYGVTERRTASKPAVNEPPSTEAYNSAVDLIAKEKYQEAIEGLEKVKKEGDPYWAVKSDYQIGRCLFLLGRYEDCARYYSKLCSKHPKHPDTKEAMFCIGQSFEKIGNREKAAVWYKKIIVLPTIEMDSIRAKALQAMKAMEDQNGH